MPLITDFSPAVRAALRQFSLVQKRRVDEGSPPVCVTGGRCQRCGFDVDVAWDGPADTLRAVTMTHELSWTTGQRCGGQVAFVSEPASTLVKGLIL